MWLALILNKFSKSGLIVVETNLISFLSGLRVARDIHEHNPDLFLQSININEAFDMSVAVGSHSFSKMEGDVDVTRKVKTRTPINIEAARQEQIRRLIILYSYIQK